MPDSPADAITSPSPRDRSLENALLFNFVIHGVALVAMALLLMPTLPGGSDATDAERIANLVAHPWLFRLGWLPWQLCAVADLWLAIAMVRVPWLPKVPAALVLLFTIAAVIPDQYAQARWVTQGVAAAQTDPELYLSMERGLFPLTAGLGAVLYTSAALFWTWCFAAAKTWSRTLSMLSFPLWLGMIVASTSPLLPTSIRPPPAVIAAVNGVSFVLLQLWLGLVTEHVLRRRRPFDAHGRLARWRHPSARAFARGVERFANSRLLGALLEPLPAFAMESDITDVVYVNYLVPAERLLPLVPRGLELQRLGPKGEHALFTFLSYRHGHFGFSFLGPLRRFMPSPVQTNWRIHVRDPKHGTIGIHFVTNALTSTLFALGARMLTEAMPMHVLAAGSVERDTDGSMRLRLDPGAGSAPDAEATLAPCDTPMLTGAFASCFASFREFLEYCVPQDRALSTQPFRQRVTRQEIELGIPLGACEPLAGTVVSRAAEAIVGHAEPLSFRVPSVHFRFVSEEYDPL